ncbi:hypothetical protein MAR_032070 [Mya arenaria]|uniref:Uncharacterized protein n=1 Tax=Mya arenaria TaxID=6604 RepID=A0ABY7F901_MYAAR|nr:hypothetical protein MAR_032070 [Mya arenaria]
MADDAEYEFIPNSTGISAVWGLFSLIRKQETSFVVENVTGSDQTKTVTKKSARFVVKDLRPFSVVNKEDL